MITALVAGPISFSASAGSMDPSAAQGIRSNRIPFFSSWTSGRITALCSIEDVITWSPGRRRPFSAAFRLSVTFFVKATFPHSL